MSVAFVFPGQNSQAVGMTADLLGVEGPRSIFDQADNLLGFGLTELMAKGPKSELDDTVNTQPALFTVCAALLECVGPSRPAFCAGHSLGEYAALYAAGVFSFADGLRLVRERGRLMKAAGEANPGGMAAIIGLDDGTVRQICAAAGGAQVANFNSPGQVVVSGTKDGVTAAMLAAKERKAKLVTALDVSIAAHSELMRSIADEYARAVDVTPMRPPVTPVIANITARPLNSVEAIRAELVGQLTSSVRWTESVEYMASQGADTFVEIGPGKVLTGLIKRIARGARLINVGDVAGAKGIAL